MNPAARVGARMAPLSRSQRCLPIPKAIRRLFEQYYDLGNITGYQRVSRGQVNTGHIVETVRDTRRSRYFVREYHLARTRPEIAFEHGLLTHLAGKKFALTGAVLKSKTGKTMVALPAGRPDRKEEAFFAVFDYLPGEIRCDWTPPLCDDRVLQSAADALARYHQAVAGWRPVHGSVRPDIVQQLRQMDEKQYARGFPAGPVCFDTHMIAHLDTIRAAREYLLTALAPAAYRMLPRLAAHGDFHPGNLMFENDRVSGIFDFDWAHVDARVFDVALAIFYFCTGWAAETDGCLDRDRVALFLQSYQGVLEKDQEIGALNRTEKRLLADMVLAANIYVLGWVLADFSSGRIDIGRFTKYLRHGVNYIDRAKAENAKTIRKSISDIGGTH